MSDPKPPTVLDLIHALNTLIKSRPEVAAMDVAMEGCDCTGIWMGGIEVDRQGIQLLRSKP